MIKLSFYFALLVVVLLRTHEVYGQQSPTRLDTCIAASTGNRVLCGNDPNGITESACPTDGNCCWNDTRDDIRPFCFIGFDFSQVEAAQNVQSNLPNISRPESNEPLRNLMRSFGDLGIEGTARTQISRQISGLGPISPLLTFPQCAVETPFCYRTACNAQFPDAETNPLTCLSNPSCCFDPDLFVYRSLFGSAIMGGAPVCYYGPTSSRYRQLASLIQPYNPFFQSIVINVFQVYLDTGANFQERVTCLVTNIIGGRQCGWPGITPLQCQLKGCCYNNATGCNYPNQQLPFFPTTTVIDEVYPELEGQSSETCPRTAIEEVAAGFSPSIYQRLPCRTPANDGERVQTYVSCRLFGCCPSIFGVIPDLGDFVTATSNSLSPTTPAIPLIAVSAGLGAGSLSQLFCPYFAIQFPFLPDLTANAAGCCEYQVCYHIRTPPPASWGQWSAFGPCLGNCGTPGIRQRTRSCVTVNGMSASTCPGESTESTRCIVPPCCQFTQWSPFGTCQATCGAIGIQIRNRFCLGPNNSPCSSCVGQTTDQRRCVGQNCGSWLSWRTWSSCTATCGTNGVRTRTRSCTITGTCSGNGNQEENCQGPPCCSWTRFGNFEPCGVTCGSGFQVRRRRCERNGIGIACNSCPGSSTNRRSCQRPPCCSWSNWSQYSTCDAPCGQSGVRTRTRTCEPDIAACRLPNACIGPSTDTLGCNGPICFTLTDWTTWGTCASSCRRERRRSCVGSDNRPVPNSFCDQTPDIMERNACVGGACLPVISTPWISWGPWYPWSDCSATCGSGIRFRERSCLYRGRQNQYLDPAICSCVYPQSEGPREEEPCSVVIACDFPVLPSVPTYTWGPWSSFTRCSRTCNGGFRSRSRTCFERPSNRPVSSTLCVGSDTQNVICNTQSCPIIGGSVGGSIGGSVGGSIGGSVGGSVGVRYTNWSSWSRCRCSTRQETRVRCPITSNNSCPNPEFQRRACTC